MERKWDDLERKLIESLSESQGVVKGVTPQRSKIHRVIGTYIASVQASEEG